MPQPSGQVLVDSGHTLAGFFAYANDSGMWNAQAGAMLTKVGSGAVTSEGGANVATSNANTYYTLASSITLSGAFSVGFRCRQTASDSRSMVLGQHTTTNNYIWLNNSGSTRFGGLTIGTNGGTTSMTTWHITRDGASQPIRLYKNGTLQATLANSGSGSLIVSALLKAYSTNTSFDFAGAVEWVHVLPAGKVLSQAEIDSLVADPYQILQTPADVAAPVLSAASVGASSGTAATGGVTTTEAGPAWAVLTTSSTTPTAAQIKAGQNHTGAAASAAATATLVVGANASAFAFSGLTPGSTYYLHVTQDDTASPANTATPVTSPGMTTPAPDTTLPVLTGSITLVSKTQTAISVSCPAGSDNVAVVAYEWSRDGGSTWADDDTTRDFAGLVASTTYAIRVRAKDAAGNVSTPALALSVTTDAPPSGTITITSPAPYQTAQRNVGAGSASVTIAGTSTATSAIEYRRGTGAWQTLVASHPGGAYSATVTMPTGQGDLQVRHASDTAVTASVPLSTVCDTFIAIGQSNNVGAATETVPPVASAFTAIEYDASDTWKPLQEGLTTGTSFSGLSGYGGSYFGALSNRLQANGVPVAFVPAAVGSTRISDWQRNFSNPTSTATLYGRALTQWNEVGGGRAAILWQGESDASAGTTKAAYKAGLHNVIDGWWTDTGTPTFLILITNFHANAPMIREAQMEVIAESAHVIGWADGGGAYSGDVHYLTATQINAVADAIYTPFVAAFYSSATVDAAVAVSRSVRTYATGTSAVARSVRAFASGAAGLARSVRGFASASAALSRSISAAGAATATTELARSVRGYASASAAIARSISSPAVVTVSVTLARRISAYALATTTIQRSIQPSGYAEASILIARSIDGAEGPLTDAEMRDLYARIRTLESTLAAQAVQLQRILDNTGLIPALI